MPYIRTERGMDRRHAMLEHKGIHCDARGTTCVQPAIVELTLECVAPDGSDDGAKLGETTDRRACRRHTRDFLERPDVWRLVSSRTFSKIEDGKHGRYVNDGFKPGSECERGNGCTTCFPGVGIIFE